MTSRVSRREAIALLAAAALGCGARPSKGNDSTARRDERGEGEQRSMLTRPILSTGEEIPVIGLGTWQTFDAGTSASARQPLEEVLAEFVRLGGRVVDSSPMYGRSESVVGDLATKLGVRDRLFVATKVWTSGRENGISQMEESERKLRGPVDLMQVHNLVDADTHLGTLREWKSARRIRYVGITHYTAGAYLDLARYLRRGRIDFVQLNYSLAEREAERHILPFAKDAGVSVLVNRPLGAGALFRTTRGKPLPAFAAEIGCSSWAELFLKFVISHPAVTCAIPATSKAEHLRQNMRAGLAPLPDEEMRKRIAETVG
jgi:diketogulonate reductase-like aldo/keto reductase